MYKNFSADHKEASKEKEGIPPANLEVPSKSIKHTEEKEEFQSMADLPSTSSPTVYPSSGFLAQFSFSVHEKHKYDALFPQNSAMKSKLMVDRDGLSYVTPWKDADHISRWIVQIYTEVFLSKRIPRIIDATAGLGGDTLAFARNSRIRKVISVEPDPIRCHCLRTNIAAYGYSHKVTTHNMNFLTWLKLQQMQTLVCPIYIDPPWGGHTYKAQRTIHELYLEDNLFNEKVGMAQLCERLLQVSPMVILKLPYNFDISALTSKFQNFSVMEIRHMIFLALLSDHV